MVALLVGCGGEPAVADVDGLVSCDPLSPVLKPITLGDVLAVGAAADGTLYVVSRSEDGMDYRVFVSEGDTLVRRRVLGGGFSVGQDATVSDFVSFQDKLTSRLVLKSEGSIAIGMALVHDDERTFYDDLTTKLELALQPASAVEAKPLRNFAGEVKLEFVALVADGAQIVVTRPRDDATYDDFRLFFGRANRLDERAVSALSRDSSTHISFALAGGQAEALFASPQLSPNALSTLSQASGDLAMTLLPTGTGVPSGWKFRCLP